MTEFVHEATVELAEGADPRALGGAITAALCGHWEHEPPCRWPHRTDIASTEAGHLVTTMFTADAAEEADVRARIVTALQSGQLTGPDGLPNRWTVRAD